MSKEFLFPHKKPRKSQDHFLNLVDQAIKNKENVLASLPTGVGKTAATIPIALKHALKNNLTVFFLTPKHTQHKIAIETLKKIKEMHQTDFTAIDFIGKKWMCPVSGTDYLGSHEFSEYCKEVRENKTCDFYTNTSNPEKIIKKQLLVDELKQQPKHVQEVCDICEEQEFCSFEISSEIAKKAKVIIADYYHILSPTIRSNFLKKIDKDLSKSIIIFDESHNLPERCRNLLTNNLSTFTINRAISESIEFNFDIIEKLEKLKEILKNLEKIPLDKKEVLIKKEKLINEIKKISDYEDLMAELSTLAEIVRQDKKKSYLSSIFYFLESWLGPDQGFARILTRFFSKNGQLVFNLGYRCLDPGIITKPIINVAHSIICMSGTLYPLQMYKDLLGFEEPTMINYKSPFPSKNKLNLIVPETSTKYTLRNSKMYESIALKLNELTEIIQGNTAIFFPSYNIRDNVFINLKKITKKPILNEQPNLNKKEKDDFLEKFKGHNKEGAILLGVSAGSFGEGIDLPGDFLKAVIVTGLPLAKPDLETEELIKFYEEKYKKGKDYGYTFPAFIKCLQNAGRCIRSETDKGVIIFLDQRYAWPYYTKHFPPNLDLKITLNAKEEIEKFYSLHKK